MTKTAMITKDHQRRFFTVLVLTAVAFFPQLVSCLVVVPEYNRSYSSMPALFGGKWSQDTVSAHLQLIQAKPLLCEEEETNETASESMVTLPSDGLPVALLVQRGQCTFYEKAVVASTWDLVEYVIVYDSEISPQLVPMSSEYPSNISLLFVSYQSGMGKTTVTYCSHMWILLLAHTNMLLQPRSLNNN
jgi:hypothetical protein